MTIFTYGSLEFAEVMRRVTGRVFASEAARLEGWLRLRFRDRVYPGLHWRYGACTPGTLWRGLDDHAIARLDRFEGALYERRALPVRSARGELVRAHVYVTPDSHRSELSHEPWDKARFARESLAEFLRSLSRS